LSCCTAAKTSRILTISGHEKDKQSSKEQRGFFINYYFNSFSQLCVLKVKIHYTGFPISST